MVGAPGDTPGPIKPSVTGTVVGDDGEDDEEQSDPGGNSDTTHD
jgi:hypothetical protein